MPACRSERGGGQRQGTGALSRRLCNPNTHIARVMELRSGQHLSGLPPALATSAERIRVLSRDGDIVALATLLQGA